MSKLLQELNPESWSIAFSSFTYLVTLTPKHLDGGQEQRQIKLSIARKINSGTRLEMIVGTKPRPRNFKTRNGSTSKRT